MTIRKTKRCLLPAIIALLILTSCISLNKGVTNVGTYQKVITVDGVDRSELYVRTLSWASGVFQGSSDEVFDVRDKDAGLLKGKYTQSFRRLSQTRYLVDNSITIEIKDGRARLTITGPDKVYSDSDKKQLFNRNMLTSDEVEEITSVRELLSKSLEYYLSTPAVDDSW